MTATDTRPALRPGVRLGRAHRRGGAVVHHVKDTDTGWYYRVGPREHAVMSMMDGSHTMAEIGTAYASRFGRRLGDEQWAQLFSLLGRRQLLDGSATPSSLESLRAARSDADRGSLLRRRFVVFRPGPLFASLAPRLGMFFSPWFVVPAFVAVVALQVFVFARFGALRSDIAAGAGLLAYLGPAIVVSWLLLVIHESAHGLTCARFGGTASELGVMWRFPIVAPYCKTDDVVLLSRRQGVAVAFAGVFANLVALLPFLVVYLVVSPGGYVRGFCAAVLLFGSVSSLINLVPFLQLDGYHMINNALGTLDLRGETYRFAGLVLRRRWSDLRPYPVRDRWAYATYAVTSLLFTLAVIATLATIWHRTMTPWFGPIGATLILLAEAMVVVALLAWAYRRRSSS